MEIEPKAGNVIANKYRLERLAGRGGMGVVWQASHTELGTTVAVKMLAAEAARDPGALQRFRREARAAAALRCPHVVDVRDFGLADGVPYIVMEYLEGESLSARLARTPGATLSELSSWVTQAAVALDYAHARGFLHRDIKPSNLFLCSSGAGCVLKVLDFGIVKSLHEADGGENTLVGSPGYLSPEQARGERLDRTTDLWSLSAVIYRALTCVEPFAAPSLAETVERICRMPVTAPTTLQPQLPLELDSFFELALCRERSGRFRSGAELAAAFAAIAGRAPNLELPVERNEKRSAIAPRIDSTFSWGSFNEQRRSGPQPPEKARARGHSPRLLFVAVGMTLTAFLIVAGLVRSAAEGEARSVRALEHPVAPPRHAEAATRAGPTPSAPLPLPSAAESASRSAEPAPKQRVKATLGHRANGDKTRVAPNAPDPPLVSSTTRSPSAAHDPTFGLPFGERGVSDASHPTASTRAFDTAE